MTKEKIHTTAAQIAEFNNRSIRTHEDFHLLAPEVQQRRLHKPERMHAWAERILTAIENKDARTLIDMIGHAGNRATQKVFEAETGLRMGQNQIQRHTAIQTWCGTDAFDAATAAIQSERDQKSAAYAKEAEERAIESMLRETVRHNGTIKSREQLFRDLFADGYKTIGFVKVGVSNVLRLSKDNSFYDFRRKVEHTFILRELLKQSEAECPVSL